MYGNSLRGASAAFETKSGSAAGTGSRYRPLLGKESAGALRLLPAVGHISLSLHPCPPSSSGLLNRKKFLVDAAVGTSRCLDGGCCRPDADRFSADPANPPGPFWKCAVSSTFVLSSRGAFGGVPLHNTNYCRC